MMPISPIVNTGLHGIGLICLNATSASCAARILAKDTPVSGDQRVDWSVLDLRRTIVVGKSLTWVFKRLREAELCVYTCSGVWIERCEKEVRQLLVHLLRAGSSRGYLGIQILCRVNSGRRSW